MATRHRVATATNSIVHGGQTYYLNNKELLAEVANSREKGQMTEKLAKMLTLLCSRLAKKGNFVGYSYNTDMQGYAMMMIVRTWKNFDETRSDNPFAFYTQCVKNSFIQFLNQEKRQRNIRDQVLIDQGLNPSYGYDDGTRRADPDFEDEQDFDTIKETADRLRRDELPDAPIERDETGQEIPDTSDPDLFNIELEEELPEQ